MTGRRRTIGCAALALFFAAQAVYARDSGWIRPGWYEVDWDLAILVAGPFENEAACKVQAKKDNELFKDDGYDCIYFDSDPGGQLRRA